MDWRNLEGLYRWIAAIGLFIVVFSVLSLVRRLLWNRLRRLASRTEAQWDDQLLDGLGFPLRILFLLCAAGAGLQMAPPEVRNHPAAIYGLKIALLLCGIWIAERVLTVFLRASSVFGPLTDTTRTLALTTLRVLFLSLGLLSILDTLGVSITPLLASLGVGSVAVALALQDTLSNFFSGLYLLLDRPIRIGDFIQLDGGVEGYVVKIGWRSTQVRQLSNNVVVVPNSKIAVAQLTNYDLPERETAVLVQVGVSYDSDLEKVERVTSEVGQEIMKRVPGGIPTFAPFIRYHTFGDSSINFTVIPRAYQFTDNYLIKHEFIKALHARYRREGIEIPFPQRVVHMAEAGK